MQTVITTNPNSEIEKVFATCLFECKAALDGHLASLVRTEHAGHASTAQVSYADHQSWSAVARTALEWAAMTLQAALTIAPRNTWRDKHGYVGDLLYLLIKRTHENNVVADRVGCNYEQWGMDFIKWLEVYYTCLAEATDPLTRREAYRSYGMMPHVVRHKDAHDQGIGSLTATVAGKRLILAELDKALGPTGRG